MQQIGTLKNMVSFESEKTLVLQNYFIYCKNLHLNNLKVKNKNILNFLSHSLFYAATFLWNGTSM